MTSFLEIREVRYHGFSKITYEIMTAYFLVHSHIFPPEKKIVINIFYLYSGQIFFKVKTTTIKGPRSHKQNSPMRRLIFSLFDTTKKEMPHL